MPLLLEIAQCFSSDASVRGLATYLLKDVGQGGPAFLSRLKEDGARLDPQIAAHKVLCEWVKRQPREAYGKRLLAVLDQPGVNKTAAFDFKDELLRPSSTEW